MLLLFDDDDLLDSSFYKYVQDRIEKEHTCFLWVGRRREKGREEMGCELRRALYVEMRFNVRSQRICSRVLEMCYRVVLAFQLRVSRDALWLLWSEETNSTITKTNNVSRSNEVHCFCFFSKNTTILKMTTFVFAFFLKQN